MWHLVFMQHCILGFVDLYILTIRKQWGQRRKGSGQIRRNCVFQQHVHRQLIVEALSMLYNYICFRANLQNVSYMALRSPHRSAFKHLHAFEHLHSPRLAAHGGKKNYAAFLFLLTGPETLLYQCLILRLPCKGCLRVAWWLPYVLPSAGTLHKLVLS